MSESGKPRTSGRGAVTAAAQPTGELVERLRARHIISDAEGLSLPPTDLELEAADEIERLRAESDALTKMNDRQGESIVDLMDGASRRSALPQQGAGEGGEESVRALPRDAPSDELVETITATIGDILDRYVIYGNAAQNAPCAVYDERDAPPTRRTSRFLFEGGDEECIRFIRGIAARAAIEAYQKAIAGDPRGKADSPSLSPGLRREVVEDKDD